jgi:hypothetical protein
MNERQGSVAAFFFSGVKGAGKRYHTMHGTGREAQMDTAIMNALLSAKKH